MKTLPEFTLLYKNVDLWAPVNLIICSRLITCTKQTRIIHISLFHNFNRLKVRYLSDFETQLSFFYIILYFKLF